MKRRLEPLKRAGEESPRTPLDLMADVARALVAALVVATFALTAIAYALSELPGVSP